MFVQRRAQWSNVCPPRLLGNNQIMEIRQQCEQIWNPNNLPRGQMLIFPGCQIWGWEELVPDELTRGWQFIAQCPRENQQSILWWWTQIVKIEKKCARRIRQELWRWLRRDQQRRSLSKKKGIKFQKCNQGEHKSKNHQSQPLKIVTHGTIYLPLIIRSAPSEGRLQLLRSILTILNQKTIRNQTPQRQKNHHRSGDALLLRCYAPHANCQEYLRHRFHLWVSPILLCVWSD